MKATFLMAVPPAAVPPLAASAAVPPACTRDGGGVPRIPSGGDGSGGDGAAAGGDAYRELLQSKVRSDASVILTQTQTQNQTQAQTPTPTLTLTPTPTLIPTLTGAERRGDGCGAAAELGRAATGALALRL